MMLPSSLPLIRLFDAVSRKQERPWRARGAFLGGYVAVWTGVRRAGLPRRRRSCTARSTPFLARRAAVAHRGQRARARRRLPVLGPEGPVPVEVPRSPARICSPTTAAAPRPGSGSDSGTACICLGCCWALMLVMFAAGVAVLWWMAALTAVMVYEKTGRHGPRLTPVVGFGAARARRDHVRPSALAPGAVLTERAAPQASWPRPCTTVPRLFTPLGHTTRRWKMRSRTIAWLAAVPFVAVLGCGVRRLARPASGATGARQARETRPRHEARREPAGAFPLRQHDRAERDRSRFHRGGRRGSASPRLRQDRQPRRHAERRRRAAPLRLLARSEAAARARPVLEPDPRLRRSRATASGLALSAVND